MKATEDLGYYLAVTTVESIGVGTIRQQTGDLMFSVVFSSITFKLYRREVLEGVVDKVLSLGVFLRCGPVKNIYLCHQKMPGYSGETPMFNNRQSKIEEDVVVRFIVIRTKWMEAQREFQALVSMEGD